jgi:hypothetical protein
MNQTDTWWLEVGARINHTTSIRSQSINAHSTRLVKATMEQCSKVQKNQHRLRRDTCTVASEHPKLYSIIGGGTCCNNATKYKKELNQLPITISVRKKPGKGHSLSYCKAEHPRPDTGLGLIHTTIRKSTIMFVQEFLVTKANNY